MKAAISMLEAQIISEEQTLVMYLEKIDNHKSFVQDVENSIVRCKKRIDDYNAAIKKLEGEK